MNDVSYTPLIITLTVLVVVVVLTYLEVSLLMWLEKGDEF